jgi:ATP-dependent helicase STH1/SNF2
LNIDGKALQADKSDDRSTNDERNPLLRTMLEAKEKDVGHNEELGAKGLNEICARNDDELALFKRIDQEKKKELVYGPNGRIPRLFTEEKVPELYLQDDTLSSKRASSSTLVPRINGRTCCLDSKNNL